MKSLTLEQRQAENEVVFRSYNERIRKEISRFDKVAKEVGDLPFDIDGDTPLHFYCECSDENCEMRVRISPNRYNQIHQKRDQFVIVRGHEVPSIETVSAEEPEYSVVTKYNTPSQSVSELHTTDTKNV